MGVHDPTRHEHPPALPAMPELVGRITVVRWINMDATESQYVRPVKCLATFHRSRTRPLQVEREIEELRRRSRTWPTTMLRTILDPS